MPRPAGKSPVDPVYEDALIRVIAAIVAAQLRGGQWLAGDPTASHDQAWRRDAVAEFAGWRGLLALLPHEAPPQYARVQARLVRWAGAFADAGDRYAHLMATGEQHLVQDAQRHIENLPILYRAMEEALIEMNANR